MVPAVTSLSSSVFKKFLLFPLLNWCTTFVALLESASALTGVNPVPTVPSAATTAKAAINLTFLFIIFNYLQNLI
jgi:hypothetical protein